MINNNFMLIRKAKITDIPAITWILNESIRWGKATAIREEVSEENRREWFAGHSTELYTVYVAEIEGQVVGYLSLGPYRKGRQAFRHTAEVSYFVNFNHHRRGIAKALIEMAFSHCKKNQIHNLLAFLMEHNEGSIQFLLKSGFDMWGRFPKTLVINGNEYDHLIFGKKLKK